MCVPGIGGAGFAGPAAAADDRRYRSTMERYGTRGPRSRLKRFPTCAAAPARPGRDRTTTLETWELRVSYLEPDAGRPENVESASEARHVLPPMAGETDHERVPRPAAGGSAPAGSSAVLAAAPELDSLSDLPLAEHPDVYERVHTALQDALADIDPA